MPRHKHADMIKQWAECPSTEFQFRGSGLQSNCWSTMVTPDWTHQEIRQKPAPKLDVISSCHVRKYMGQSLNDAGWVEIRLTYSGETGELRGIQLV